MKRKIKIQERSMAIWEWLQMKNDDDKPRSGGKSTEFGAGDFISAAIGPRRLVGVHFSCFTPILFSYRVRSTNAVVFLPLYFRMN